MEKQTLDPRLHEQIINAAKLFYRKEQGENISVAEGMVALTDILENQFNAVSDVYIYEAGFSSTATDLKNTLLHAITSVITFDYNNKNLTYLQDLILASDDHKSDITLDFLLKIGTYHEKFRQPVLNFVGSQLQHFSKNKLNLTAFYLTKAYKQDHIVSSMLQQTQELYHENFGDPDQQQEKEVIKESNKPHPLEEFQRILLQQQENANKSINQELCDDILKTAKIIEGTKDKSNPKEIVDNLRERFKNEDLNQVVNLFIYYQSFLSTNEEPLPLPSQLCIAIGKLFNYENLHYTASKVYSDDEIEGGSALSFLGYLAIHEQHTPYVLNFIKENFKGFSNNKKTECVFQLKETLPENEIAKQIIKDSGITKYELVFSTEEDSTSIPITFKKDNFVNEYDNTKQSFQNPKPNIQVSKTKLPWWKFWSKNN